jgi:hypothetical protein
MRHALIPIAASAAIVFAGGTAEAATGFTEPQVTGTYKALDVTFTNTSGHVMEAVVAGSDGGEPYVAQHRRVAPGEQITVRLVASQQVRRAVARSARKRRVVRRPAVYVTDLVTNESDVTVPRIAVPRGAR